MKHDNVVHYPPGAAAYYYQSKLVFLRSQLRYAGVNTSSPHAGTLICFALAFALVKALKDLHPSLFSLDFVDTAAGDGTIDVTAQDGYYRKTHEFSRMMEVYLDDYFGIMDTFSSLAGGIRWTHTFQSHLNSQPAFPTVVRAVIAQRDVIGQMVPPTTKMLPIHTACPHEGCGLADKSGKFNEYVDNHITFLCLNHGKHSIALDNLTPADCKRLEFNTPLRNLIRNLVWGMDENTIHMRVTGSDYAGSYQVDMFARPWRHMIRSHPELAPFHGDCANPPVTIFNPLITDWSGSKLSDSYYIKEGAYKYLKDQGVDYLLSVTRMKELGYDPGILFHEVTRWLDEPKHLFTRSYSVEYIHSIFARCEGDGHQALVEDGVNSHQSSSVEVINHQSVVAKSW